MADEPWTADRIARTRFRPVRARHGYDMGDVDRFLDRLEAALRAGEPVAALVEQAQFSTTSLREGYDMGEVDAFLDEVAGSSPPATPPTAPSTAPSTAPPVAGEPQPVAVQEQRGLLSRLLSRR